jgi:DNA-binding XRE family transcriptional regulator
MSIRSRLEERAGPRVQVRDVARVRSGSPGKFLLETELSRLNAPGAARALAKRHLPLKQAHAVVTELFDGARAIVALPMVEDVAALVDELAGCGVTATPYGAPARIDVRAVREATGLSQEGFALHFGLDAATVRNWEQGRSEPDTAARSFLQTIRANPDAVRAALTSRPTAD